MKPQDMAASAPGVEGARLDVEAVYLQHKDAMWGMARSMLRGDEERAKDIVQEVMLAIVARMPRNIDNWEAYLVTAVKNKIRDFWKSAARQHELLLLDDAAPLEDECLGADNLTLDPATAVEESYERAVSVAVMREALAELRTSHPVEHDVFLKAKHEERTSNSIATEMGVSDSRVRQHLMTARSELMKILEARGGVR
ncbi:MAG: RNA polymerase sigma factor [Actinomycetales bacterium]|nr:RNA polymerase sigma factor [Candidatus Lutibacillus vidarii]